MKLIAQVKLLPTPEQADALKRTLELASAACDFVSRQVWKTETFKQYALHHLYYKDVRAKFALSAQVAVRVIAKIADAYKLDHKRKRTFKPLGCIAFDDRILTWRLQDSMVSIWSVDGRLRIPLVCGECQRELPATRPGQSGLGLFRNTFFLAATCNVEELKPMDMAGALGVDLGVTHIAVDSDGAVHAASQIHTVRCRHRRLRTKLQAKGTRSAKRHLKKLSGKEHRFAKGTNYCISKKLVAKAKDTGRALEDLNGIRDQVTVRRSQRATLHTRSGAFFQLRSFVEYKSKRAGVPVVWVDPRNTSRTCPQCGHIDKANRKSQSVFACVACSHSGLADHIAAINIGRRAAVNPPIVARALPKVAPAPASAATIHPLLARGS